MTFFGKRSRYFLIAAGVLLVLSGCKTTSYAGSGRSADYYQNLVESSIDDEDWEGGVDVIRNAPSRIDDDFHDWLEDNAEKFPPIYLYAMADRFYDVDKEQATKWYFAARVRHACDLMQCKDVRAMKRLDVFEDRFRNSVYRFIPKDPKDAFKAAEDGLEWEYEADVHETSPASECLFGLAKCKRSKLLRSDYLDEENEEELVSSRRAGKRLISQTRRMVRNEVEDIEDRFGKKKRKSKRNKRTVKRKFLWADDVHKEDWGDDDDDHDHDHNHAWNSHKWHDHDDNHHGHDHQSHTSHAAWRDRPWRLSAQPDYRPTYQTHHNYYVFYPDR
jgi:hypothetical protein